MRVEISTESEKSSDVTSEGRINAGLSKSSQSDHRNTFYVCVEVSTESEKSSDDTSKGKINAGLGK